VADRAYHNQDPTRIFGAFFESVESNPLSLLKETTRKEKVAQWQWVTGTNYAGRLKLED
jgi:hypothetical protein